VTVETLSRYSPKLGGQTALGWNTGYQFRHVFQTASVYLQNGGRLPIGRTADWG